MTDIKLSPLAPVSRLKPPQYPSCLQQLSNVAAYLIASMRRHIVKTIDHAEPEPPPAIPSPWDRLIASSASFCYISISNTEKPSGQKGVLISSLIEFTPHLDKYHLTHHGKNLGVHGYYPSVFIGFNDKQPLCFISATEAAISAFRHLDIIKSPPPMIPTILVTDFDGAQPSGTCYCYLDESHKAMSAGGGLLWREWRGKFSPNRNQYGAGVRDQTYFEGVPPTRVEEGVEHCVETPIVKDPIIKEDTGSKELEWWEIECDDESENFQEESDSDLDDEDDEDDGSDEDDSEFSGSEDGDDEYEDDSEDGDDDSGEDSDLEEEPNKQLTEMKVYSITSHHLSALEAPAPSLHEPRSNPLTQTQAKALNYYQDTQDTQDLKENNNEGVSPSSSSPSSPSSPYLSVVDSDFESYNSSTTMSSLSPTPVTPASPFIVPLDICVSHRLEQRKCGDNYTSGSLQIPESPWGLVASLDLDLGAIRRARWEFDDDISLGKGILVRKSLSMEGLDLAG